MPLSAHVKARRALDSIKTLKHWNVGYICTHKGQRLFRLLFLLSSSHLHFHAVLARRAEVSIFAVSPFPGVIPSALYYLAKRPPPFPPKDPAESSATISNDNHRIQRRALSTYLSTCVSVYSCRAVPCSPVYALQTCTHLSCANKMQKGHWRARL